MTPEARAAYVLTMGCDASNLIHIELTDDGFATVQRVAEAMTDNSEYGCQPSMYVSRTSKTEDDFIAEFEP
jgi:hypothetical protein